MSNDPLEPSELDIETQIDAGGSPTANATVHESHNAVSRTLDKAVVEAALQWWCERTVNDWAEADLARAIVRLEGDWPGCEGCDHDCDEPCMPATMAEQLHSIDCRIAQLVHDGKLARHEGYEPPAGWKPVEMDTRRRRSPVAPLHEYPACAVFRGGRCSCHAGDLGIQTP